MIDTTAATTTTADALAAARAELQDTFTMIEVTEAGIAALIASSHPARTEAILDQERHRDQLKDTANDLIEKIGDLARRAEAEQAADYQTPADVLAEMITARRAWQATKADKDVTAQAADAAREARIATYAQYKGQRSADANKARKEARELADATYTAFELAYELHNTADQLWNHLRRTHSNAIGHLAYAATADTITAKHDHEMLAEHYAETDDDSRAIDAYYQHYNQQTLAQWEKEAENAAKIVAHMESHGGPDALRIARERQAAILASLEQAREADKARANAERQAARKNRAQDQALPLLAYAGLIEQVADRWTADRHLALKAACIESLAEAQAASEARALEHTALYMELCHELTDDHQMQAWTLRCNKAGFPKRPHYIANFWYERMKDALGLAGRCACGGIWVCGMLQQRRSGDEPTSILDWYCSRCQATPDQAAAAEQPQEAQIVQYMAAELIGDEQAELEQPTGLAAAAARAIESPTVTSAAEFAAINAAQAELAELPASLDAAPAAYLAALEAGRTAGEAWLAAFESAYLRHGTTDPEARSAANAAAVYAWLIGAHPTAALAAGPLAAVEYAADLEPIPLAETRPEQIRALLLAADPARLPADGARIYGIVATTPTARKYYEAAQAARSLPHDDDTDGYYNQWSAVALAAELAADLLAQAAREAHPRRSAWTAYIAASRLRERYSAEYRAACTAEDQARTRVSRAWTALRQATRPESIERATQRQRAAQAARDEAGNARSIAARYYLISAEIAAAIEDHYFQIADAEQLSLAA